MYAFICCGRKIVNFENARLNTYIKNECPDKFYLIVASIYVSEIAQKMNGFFNEIRDFLTMTLNKLIFGVHLKLLSLHTKRSKRLS